MMNAMILAAGRGERMRPLTDHCPKPLLKVKGKSLIAYHLEALKKAGIKSVVINVCWLADQLQQVLGDGSDFGIEISYSHEHEALETAGGILNALDKLEDEFIVINGDVFTDYDFTNLPPLTHQAHLVMVENPAHNPGGDFAIDQGLLSNRIAGRLTFSGISCYRKSFFNDIDVGKMALAPLLRRAADNDQITAERYDGLWSDVGTSERLQSLQNV